MLSFSANYTVTDVAVIPALATPYLQELHPFPIHSSKAVFIVSASSIIFSQSGDGVNPATDTPEKYCTTDKTRIVSFWGIL